MLQGLPRARPKRTLAIWLILGLVLPPLPVLGASWTLEDPRPQNRDGHAGFGCETCHEQPINGTGDRSSGFIPSRINRGGINS